jgi:hypothetical protein
MENGLRGAMWSTSTAWRSPKEYAKSPDATNSGNNSSAAKKPNVANKMMALGNDLMDVEGCKKHVQGRNWMGKETSEMKWMGSYIPEIGGILYREKYPKERACIKKTSG